MYIFKNMIDLGLKDGQTWPSDEHREVAAGIGTCNSMVRSRDALTEVCQAVILIPADRIKTVTFKQAALEFKVPYVPGM